VNAWLLALALGLSSPASADEEADREAAMFGTDDAAPTETEAKTEGRLLDRLEETQDTLALGGQLYLRYQGMRTNIEGPAPFAGEDDDLAAPALLDLYLDARPSDRVRSYTRMRLTHRAIADDTDWLLDQLWLKFDVSQALFVTVGRQHIKWGVGRLWNPTDFLMEVRDPLAVFDERTGRNFLKLHLPWEAMGWTLYAVGEVAAQGDRELPGGAVRAELVLGPAEVALTGYKREDAPGRVGADLSAGLGPIDLRAEAATDDDSDKVRAVVGAEAPFNYSEEDSATIGVEYLENQLPDAASPLYRGERGVGGYLVLMAPGSWNDTTVITNFIHNLDQKDWLARLDWQVRALTYLRVNVYAQHSRFVDLTLPSTDLSFDVQASEGGVGFTLSL
jgi:hypothetical protein